MSLLLILTAGAVSLIACGSPSGQPALEIEIAGEDLDYATAMGPTLGNVWQTITVYVDDHECGTVNVTSNAPRNAVGNIEARSGRGLDVSPECTKEDGVVHFVNGRGDELFVRFVVKDSPLLLDNLAPVPPIN
jgi:hypothetical protein